MVIWLPEVPSAVNVPVVWKVSVFLNVTVLPALAVKL